MASIGKSGWQKYFSDAEAKQMLSDDLLAGRSVSGVLFAIVAVGVVGMIATLLLVLS